MNRFVSAMQRLHLWAATPGEWWVTLNRWCAERWERLRRGERT